MEAKVMYQFSSSSIHRMRDVDARLREIAHMALTISAVDFGIPEDGGLRTDDRQLALYKAGKSQLDGIKGVSNHQTGKALDFYAFVNGKASWDTQHLAMVAAAFLQAASLCGYKLKWGGFFKPYKIHNGDDFKSGWDYPHVELEN
jgi:peptidoglycan L-alanyl-D-glutamate endopeptidase CwlK